MQILYFYNYWVLIVSVFNILLTYFIFNYLYMITRIDSQSDQRWEWNRKLISILLNGIDCQEVCNEEDMDTFIVVLLHQMKDQMFIKILERHYGLDWCPAQSYDQISKEFGILRIRIQQIHNQAIQKMRRILKNHIQLESITELRQRLIEQVEDTMK